MIACVAPRRPGLGGVSPRAPSCCRPADPPRGARLPAGRLSRLHRRQPHRGAGRDLARRCHWGDPADGRRCARRSLEHPTNQIDDRPRVLGGLAEEDPLTGGAPRCHAPALSGLLGDSVSADEHFSATRLDHTARGHIRIIGAPEPASAGARKGTADGEDTGFEIAREADARGLHRRPVGSRWGRLRREVLLPVTTSRFAELFVLVYVPFALPLLGSWIPGRSAEGTALHGQVDGFREALAEITAQELAGAAELSTLAASSEPGGQDAPPARPRALLRGFGGHRGQDLWRLRRWRRRSEVGRSVTAPPGQASAPSSSAPVSSPSDSSESSENS